MSEYTYNMTKSMKAFIVREYFQYSYADNLINASVFTTNEIERHQKFFKDYCDREDDNVYYFTLDNDQVQNIRRTSFFTPRKYKEVGEDIDYFDPTFSWKITVSSCSLEFLCNKQTFVARLCYPNWIKYTPMTSEDYGVYYMSESEDGDGYDSEDEDLTTGTSCSICSLPDSTTKLGCRHAFHYDCIKNYCLEREQQCQLKSCSNRCPIPNCIKCPVCLATIDVATFVVS